MPAPFDVKRIYLRESDQTTTEISASQCTQPSCAGPELDAIYQGASDDGSVIFFSSRAQLTDAATAGGGLYRYEVGSGDLTLLTPDATDPGGAGVEGAVGNSDDGSVIYFVATGKLADGATLGADNLYVYDATTAATRFIATLISPAPDGSSLGDSYIWNGSETFKPAEVTPSGGDLVFRTAAPLAAGYDNAGHQEIYRYRRGRPGPHLRVLPAAWRRRHGRRLVLGTQRQSPPQHLRPTAAGSSSRRSRRWCPRTATTSSTSTNGTTARSR